MGYESIDQRGAICRRFAFFHQYLTTETKTTTIMLAKPNMTLNTVYFPQGSSVLCGTLMLRENEPNHSQHYVHKNIVSIGLTRQSLQAQNGNTDHREVKQVHISTTFRHLKRCAELR